MKSKMVLMAIVLASTMAITGLQQASARGVGYQGDTPRHSHKLDDASKAKLEKFLTDNKDLRKKIAMKKAEESALVRSETPNVEAVKMAAGELFDLKSTLREKAANAGLFASMHKEGKEGKTENRHEKFVKFFADTKDLRKQIAQDKAVKRALMHSRTPDPLAVSKIAGELFDLKSSLHDKAVAAGLPRFDMRHHGNMYHRGHNYGMMKF